MTDFYDKMLKIFERYHPSGGKSVLDRQITSHLNKTPDTLTESDKNELARWGLISGRLLLGDEDAGRLVKEILRS